MGETGVVQGLGVEFTKVDRAALDALMSTGDYEALSSSCTTDVTDMSELFYDHNLFDEAIGSWDTSSATNMSGMFVNATSFNQPLGDWDTGRVTDMRRMFFQSKSFAGDLSTWCVSFVVNREDFSIGSSMT